MKPILLALTFAAAVFRLHADGTIAFANSRLTRVQILEPGKTSRPATAEDNLLIGVFYGPPQSDADSLLPASGFATIGLEPGLMTNAPNIFPLPGTAPNSVVSLQVRAWDAALGPDGWKLVPRFPCWGTTSPYCEAGGKFYGETKISQLTIGPSNGPGTVIWQTASGLNPYRFTPLQITICPESPGGPNIPPAIAITWPKESDLFGAGTYIKIKVDTSDADGDVAVVNFYANSIPIRCSFYGNSFGPAWKVGELYGESLASNIVLTAVAVDNRGMSMTSAPVTLSVSSNLPASPIIQIISPSDNTMLPAHTDFEFSAEVLASTGDAGPIAFVVDEVPVGRAEGEKILAGWTPKSSITISNLAEGDHRLTVQYLGTNLMFCTCRRFTNTIHVVKLGVHSPRRTLDGHAQFDVVTSFPGRKTIIEASPNLYDWMPLATNIPVSTSFIFTDTSFVSRSNWFYRARVPLD